MNFRVSSFENRYKLGYNLLPGLVKNKHFTYVGALRDLAQRALLPISTVVLLDKPLPNDVHCSQQAIPVYLFRMPLPFSCCPCAWALTDKANR